MNELIKDIESWSSMKGLNKADSFKQLTKVTEELGEVAVELLADDTDKLKIEIGDTIIALIVLAQQKNLTVAECINKAFIKNTSRNSEMVNGVLVSEND